MQRPFSTFVGIDLGGARGRTTALSRLVCEEDETGVSVLEVTTRRSGTDVWHDSVLVDYLAEIDGDAVVAINAPLTVPACLRCQRPVCPGKDACVDPAVIWLRTRGAEVASGALERDRDRIAAVSPGTASGSGVSLPQGPGPRIEPYVHRGSEVLMHYQRGLLPRDALGLGTGPIAARAAHLRRILAGVGYVLNDNLLEVSPRATVHALFGPRMARGYKRDADPWHTRAIIVERLGDLRFAPRSRMSREGVLRNDHCFDALLSGYTAFLWARDGWTLPDGVFAEDGWIWAPPG